MFKKAFTLIATVVILHFAQLAAAQTVQFFDGQNSALPAGTISSVGIDNKGVKWVSAGARGLFTYDGHAFTPYTSAVIQGKFGEFFKDSKGNLWIPFSDKQNMLGRYDGSNWKVFTETDEPLLKHGVYKMAEDNKGNIYMGILHGLIVYNGKGWKQTLKPIDSLDGGGIISLDVQGDRIAVGTTGNLLLYDGRTWQKLDENNSELRLGTVRAVKYAPDGSLYIGYGGGFGDGGFSLLKDNKWKHYNRQNSKMPDHMVRTIRFTPGGAVWMATNNGAVKIDGDKWTIKKFNSGPFDAILDIAVENDHVVWIVDVAGLARYED